jgi:hypothetical protein
MESQPMSDAHTRLLEQEIAALRARVQELESDEGSKGDRFILAKK